MSYTGFSIQYFVLIGLVSLVLISCNPVEKLFEKRPSISGTITVDPALVSHITDRDRLFIIARRVEGGPPLAVQRIVEPRFPLKYWLTQEDVMMPGTAFTGEAVVVARIDKDGRAGPPQPGDLEGVFKGNPVLVGSQGVDIVIDKLYEEKRSP